MMPSPKRLLDALTFRRRATAASRARQAQALSEKIVKMSKADAIDVTINAGLNTNVRFAANQMSTAGSIVDANVAVQSSFGPKHAVVATNDLSDEALQRTVDAGRAAGEARAGRPGIDAGARSATICSGQCVVRCDGESERRRAREGRAQRARTGARRGRRDRGRIPRRGRRHDVLRKPEGAVRVLPRDERELHAHGAHEGRHRARDGPRPIIRTGSRSTSPRSPKRAIEKARASRNPQKVEPGRYTVILEAQAVGDLVQLVGNYADARTSDEGRSPFVKEGGGNKIGEKIVDNRVTIFSDPADPQLLAQPFDGEGFPIARQVWIENGVLKQLYYSRFWAKKQGKQPTGAPSSLKMSGGSASIDEMIRGTERGILVTRLWYLREVDPRTILYTGLTRDGTFLIENGKISHAVRRTSDSTNHRCSCSIIWRRSERPSVSPAPNKAARS